MLPYQWKSVLRHTQRCAALLLAGDNKKHFSLKKFSSLLLGTIGNYRSIQLWSLEICMDKLNVLSETEVNCLVCPIHTTKLSWPSEYDGCIHVSYWEDPWPVSTPELYPSIVSWSVHYPGPSLCQSCSKTRILDNGVVVLERSFGNFYFTWCSLLSLNCLEQNLDISEVFVSDWFISSLVIEGSSQD